MGQRIGGYRQINAAGAARRAIRARQDLVADLGRRRQRVPTASFSGEQRGAIGDAYGGVKSVSGANVGGGFQLVAIGTLVI